MFPCLPTPSVRPSTWKANQFLPYFSILTHSHQKDNRIMVVNTSTLLKQLHVVLERKLLPVWKQETVRGNITSSSSSRTTTRSKLFRLQTLKLTGFLGSGAV
jgi:hypothetical protein